MSPGGVRRFMGRYSVPLAQEFVGVADLDPGQRVSTSAAGRAR